MLDRAQYLVLCPIRHAHGWPCQSLVRQQMSQRGRFSSDSYFPLLHLRTLPCSKPCCWPWQARWGQPEGTILRTVTKMTLLAIMTRITTVSEQQHVHVILQSGQRLMLRSQHSSLCQYLSWRNLLSKAPDIFYLEKLKWKKHRCCVYLTCYMNVTSWRS